MKKISLILLVVLALFAFTLGVTASPTIRDVLGKENKNITVSFNGNPQVLRDGNENIVYPVIIDGSTYLPVRAIAKMLNLDITWNSKTQTVDIAEKTKEVSDVPTDLKDVSNSTTIDANSIPTDICLGLSKEDIFKMYGNPEYIYWKNNRKWEYKRFSSSISFDDKWKVAGWDNPPKIGFENNSSSKIFLGMTKDEVVKVFGMPVYIDPNVSYQWEYIRFSSYVWFDEEWKVIGWQNMTKDFEK